ncbi:hypothetical protein LL06_25845 [Hoeflea sp. BAL378]|nr:hypothetical protein LL06_25845 [Hoeflea sp. BAL378]
MRTSDTAAPRRTGSGLSTRASGGARGEFFAARPSCACGLQHRGLRRAGRFPGEFGGALGALGVDRIVFDPRIALDLHDIRR